MSVSRKGTKCQGSPQGLPLVYMPHGIVVLGSQTASSRSITLSSLTVMRRETNLSMSPVAKWAPGHLNQPGDLRSLASNGPTI